MSLGQAAKAALVPVTLRSGRQLSALQRGLWASQRKAPTAPLQNMAHLTHIDGEVDGDRLVAAFATVVAASDVLRSRVTDQDGAATVHLGAEPAVTGVLEIARADALAWARDRNRTPIDTAVAAYDSMLLMHEDNTCSWYLALHHIVTDATGSALVFDATAAAYENLPIDIAPFYRWASQREADTSPRLEAARTYWRDRTPAPRLGRVYRPVRQPSPWSERYPVELDNVLVGQVTDRLGGEYRMLSDDLAWTALLMTVTASLLHRTAGATDMAVGMPVHNRSTPAARELFGPVMEVFPVDVHIEADDTFLTLHQRVAKSILTTLRFAQAGAAPQTSDYETIVNVIPRAEIGAFAGLASTTDWIHPGAADPAHLLRVQLSAFDDTGLRLALDVNDATAPALAETRVPHHFGTLLAAAAADPTTPIGEPVLIDNDERAVIDAWGVGALSQSASAAHVVTQLRDALATNHSCVVSDDTVAYTGPELLARAERVASWIAANTTRGDRVAIEMTRSADALTAIYATLFAGRSYVPLDPEQPRARLDRLVERAGCTFTITKLPDDLSPFEPLDVAAQEVLDLDLADEAYLLFTSGSTGEPKGVPITHLGLRDYLAFAAASYVPTAVAPIAPLFSALTFDLTVTTLFVPILAGGGLVVIDEGGAQGLRAIADHVEITWAKATPSHLEILVRLLGDDHQLSTLVVGGEAFTSRLARRLWRVRPDLTIFNEYGPTEAVVGCMIHQASPDAAIDNPDVPIGLPAPGVTLRIVDQCLQPTPVGAVGELCISHRGMTAGYLGATENDPDSPFVTIDGDWFYRSGDLVRLIDDHTATYLGRADEQMKVGGIRLDPSEVDAALAEHPAINRAATRLWAPTHIKPDRHCVRCGLPSNIPGVAIDPAGICDTCHSYDHIKDTTASYFRTLDDLADLRDKARAERTGEYDCIHLLSGGKDSTYALYQLVEMGFKVFALTLDNGFISPGALENCRKSVTELGVDHEIATSNVMNEIFRDSLERHSNVCHGCYKTIYTLATNKAAELGAPMIVTGLSRGQLFETRLIPQQFDDKRFDPDAIDRAVIEARKAYHRLDDGPNRLLDNSIFEDDEIFDRISYVDFYRYIDVELAEMLDFLTNSAPWVRPKDAGRSTNCLINAAGIHTHISEQGYHNYAEPYAWDVRLGHKTRHEAMDELDDQLDLDDVYEMLAKIDYQPKRREILTSWVELAPGAELPSPTELRAFLSNRLPSHSIPAAFVVVSELPITTNGKLDADALPAPERIHRQGPTLYVSPASPTEELIVSVWERLLKTEPIGIDDDFFALGGDSLGALEMAVAVSSALERTIGEELVFIHTTPRDLARLLDLEVTSDDAPRYVEPSRRGPNEAPQFSAGEQAMLFERELLPPEDPRYNVGHFYVVDGDLDQPRVRHALESVIARHAPFHWTYGSPRRRLAAADAIDFRTNSSRSTTPVARNDARAMQAEPFDLKNGPLLRCLIQPLSEGGTSLALVCHHVSVDAGSFDLFWTELDHAYRGLELPSLSIDYAEHAQWQEARDTAGHRAYWAAASNAEPATWSALPPVAPAEDAYVDIVSNIGSDALRSAVGPTPFATALGTLAGVLKRYFAGSHIPISITATTREHPLSEHLIGYHLNALPLLVDTAANPTWAELIGVSATHLATSLPHRSYPYSQIVADRRAAGRAAPTPSILLAFEVLDAPSFGTLDVAHEVLPNGRAIADASFFVQVRDEQVVLGLEYRGTFIDAAMARQILTDFDAALMVVGGEPDRLVAATPLPSVSAAVVTSAEPIVSTTVVAQALAVGLANPTSPAARSAGETLTWGELDERSAALAASLQARGVTPGEPVLVSVARSIALPVCVLGVLRTGAVYVPLDPTYPSDRIDRVAAASQATVAVTDVGGQLSNTDVVTIAIAPDGSLVEPCAPTYDDRAALAADAYVIFTSGSTGAPSGVSITHEQLARSTAARDDFYGDDPERFLLISSISFDSSIVGMFWTLARGGSLVIPTEDQVHNVDALADLLEHERVTHTLMVPSLYAAIVERARSRASWPRQVIVAGESCSQHLVDSHYAAFPDSRITNEYGPTEATVWATAHHLAPGQTRVPIGLPVAGLWAAVVDADNQPRPANVTGDLVVGGSNVAQRYLGDAERSAARFSKQPHLGGGMSFATGDIVAWTNGALYFLGRSDHQLNVGGARIEPEEIERVLMAVDGVQAAIVTSRDGRNLAELLDEASPEVLRTAMSGAAGAEDPSNSLRSALAKNDAAGGRAVLVAHVACENTVDEADLRSAANQALSAATRPHRYVLHSSLPQMPNGKVDRVAASALPLPQVGAHDSVETKDVLGLWQSVLGRPDAGPDDDFFALGGHSLLVVELVARVEELHHVRLPLSAVFEARTARTFGNLVQQSANGGAIAGGRLVKLRSADTELPPLWLIPPSGGNHLIYEHLTAALAPDQPVYGVEFPGLRHEAEPLADLGAIADDQTQHILEAQAHGPYRLIGFSVGGAIAFEIARRLIERGETVELLAGIDAGLASAFPPNKNSRKLFGQEPIGQVIRRRDAAGVVRRAGRTVRWHRANSVQRTRKLSERAAMRLLGSRPSDWYAVRHVRWRALSAARQYVPTPLAIDMSLYLGIDNPPGLRTVLVAAWNEIATEGVRVIDVSGTHDEDTVMKPGHVEALARSIQRELDALNSARAAVVAPAAASQSKTSTNEA